jgi:hypothetical protein
MCGWYELWDRIACANGRIHFDCPREPGSFSSFAIATATCVTAAFPQVRPVMSKPTQAGGLSATDYGAQRGEEHRRCRAFTWLSVAHTIVDATFWPYGTSERVGAEASSLSRGAGQALCAQLDCVRAAPKAHNG